MATFSFHSIFLIIGAIHGLLLAAFLAYHKRGNSKANQMLSWLILFFSLNMLLPEIARNYYQKVPHVIALNYSLLFLFGPLLFFYTKLLTSDYTFSFKKEYLHFLPFALGSILLMPLLLSSSEGKIQFFEQLMQADLPAFFYLTWALECLHIIIYMIIIIQLIWRYNQRIKMIFSTIDKINLRWLAYFASANGFLWTIYCWLFIGILWGWQINVLGDLSYLFGYAASLIIYSIGYIGLFQPEIFSGVIASKINEDTIQSKKYQRSGLTTKKLADYAQQLSIFMETQQPHLNPDLTLYQLAENVNISPNHLSQVINQYYQKKFFDFINQYRVQEAKALLINPTYQHFTLLSLAFEVGFKSKSTFNNAFKKYTTMTPSQYRKMNKR